MLRLPASGEALSSALSPFAMSAPTTFLRPAAPLLACLLATGFAARAQLTITGGTCTVGPAATMSVGGSIGVAGSGTLDNQGTVTFTGDLS